MRKSTKIMSLVMVAVLLTSCFVATTMAKYSSTFTMKSGEARVAKWGFGTSTITISDLFAQTYTKSSKTIASSANEDDIICPGASGSATIAFDADDIPEVQYKITLKPKGLNTTEQILSSGITFCWTVDGQYKTFDKLSNKSISGDAGKNPTSVTLYWKWDSDTVSADEGTLASASTLPTIAVEFTAVAEQVIVVDQ